MTDQLTPTSSRRPADSHVIKMAIPQEVCKATRAVLLSSKKGVMLRDFTKDYKSLFGSEFPWRSLGYQSPLAMLQAMTTCALLTYDTAHKDHRVFGVAEGHSYISTPLLKAQWSQKKEELLQKGKGRGKKHKSRGGRRKVAKLGFVKSTVQGGAFQNQPVGVCVRYKPQPDLQWEREHWKQDQLRNLFCSVGTVKRVFVPKKGQFAFVDFSTLDEAKQSFPTFNHSYYKGKTLTIRWATPRVVQYNQRCTSSFRSTSMNPEPAECTKDYLPALEDITDGTFSHCFFPPSQSQDQHGIPDCSVLEPGSLKHSRKSPMAKLKACLEQLPLSLDTPTGSPLQSRETPAPATFSEICLPVPTDYNQELELEPPFFADHSNGSDTSSLLEDDPVITREGRSIALQQCCISEVVSPDLIYVQTSLTVVRDLANLSSSIAENELQPLTGAMPKEGDLYCVFAQGRWVRVVVVAFHDVLDQTRVMDVDTGRNLMVHLCDVRHLPPSHSLSAVPPLAIPCCLHGVCSSHLQGWWPLDCQLLWKLTNNSEVFALFCEWPTRPPACVAVELFLDSCGKESVAKRLASEGSFVTLLPEGESPLAAEGDSPWITSEERDYSLGTWKEEWEGNSPLVTPEEGRGRHAADTTPQPLEDFTELFGRSMNLQQVPTSTLSEQALSLHNVGQGSSAEGKVKKGVFGRFVSALEAMQPSTLEPSPFLT